MMKEKLEDRCRALIDRREYTECEKEIGKAMAENPHSAVTHNLMGILMEKKRDHVLAMKHFRAAYGLDPTYVPARYNMEQYGCPGSMAKYAYTEEDCPVQNDLQFEIVYDKNHIGHRVRK